jgi:Arc/MetJ family transcription regulator
LAVRKTTLTVDDDVLSMAQEALGTTGVKDKIDAALEQAIVAETHRDYFDRLRTRRGLDLDDPEVMGQAWPRGDR